MRRGRAGREQSAAMKDGMASNAPDSLDFNVIREPLDTLQIAVVNKIDREPIPVLSKIPGSHVVLRSFVQLARNTYNTVRYICADQPPDPQRKPQYALSVPPLIRTIVDSLCTVVFLFEDLPKHTSWFLKSGWRDVHETHQRFLQAHGSDPCWMGFLEDHGESLARIQNLYKVTAAEASDPTRVKWWPHPGKMIRHPSLSAERKKYLQYLDDWFYGALSADSHQNAYGLMRRGGHLIEHDEATLQKYKSDYVFTTVTVLLALLSELEVELDLGLKQRVKFLWGILVQYWGELEGLHRARYEQLLA